MDINKLRSDKSHLVTNVYLPVFLLSFCLTFLFPEHIAIWQYAAYGSLLFLFLLVIKHRQSTLGDNSFKYSHSVRVTIIMSTQLWFHGICWFIAKTLLDKNKLQATLLNHHYENIWNPWPWYVLFVIIFALLQNRGIPMVTAHHYLGYLLPRSFKYEYAMSINLLARQAQLVLLALLLATLMANITIWLPWINIPVGFTFFSLCWFTVISVLLTSPIIKRCIRSLCLYRINWMVILLLFCVCILLLTTALQWIWQCFDLPHRVFFNEPSYLTVHQPPPEYLLLTCWLGLLPMVALGLSQLSRGQTVIQTVLSHSIIPLLWFILAKQCPELLWSLLDRLAVPSVILGLVLLAVFPSMKAFFIGNSYLFGSIDKVRSDVSPLRSFILMSFCLMAFFFMIGPHFVIYVSYLMSIPCLLTVLLAHGGVMSLWDKPPS